MGITIRLLGAQDIPLIYSSFADIGSHRPPGLFERYLDEQDREKRSTLVAFMDEIFAGYVTINWWPDYLPFAEKGIPLIQDLNVLPAYRRRGMATDLVDEAERRIFERSPVAGIGVGLHADYGAAQRMYVLRGYVPDGLGLAYKEHQVRPGQEVRVDDDLCLYFIKEKDL
ncbi:GNAT family N-acetyltransferase [Chloroflexota bacterium]